MLTGTETNPKEIVAVPIERAGIWVREWGCGNVEEEVGLRANYYLLCCVTKIFNVGNFSLSNFRVGHL